MRATRSKPPPPPPKEEKLPTTFSIEEFKMLCNLHAELQAEQALHTARAQQVEAAIADAAAHQRRIYQKRALTERLAKLQARYQISSERKRLMVEAAAAKKKRSLAAQYSLCSSLRLLQAQEEGLRLGHAALLALLEQEAKVARAGDFLRWRLVGKLKLIYPVTRGPDPDEPFAIAGLPLPNSDFTGCDEEQVAAALGCVAHVLLHLGRWFDVPLRYPILLLGSRSLITDEVAHPAAPRFPLFSVGVDRARFEYGVFLLNKDLEQVLHSQGFNVANLKQTLPNLTMLLQHQLRVPASPTVSVPLSSLSSSSSSSLPSASPTGNAGSLPVLRPGGIASTTPPGPNGARLALLRRDTAGQRPLPLAAAAFSPPPEPAQQPGPGPVPPKKLSSSKGSPRLPAP